LQDCVTRKIARRSIRDDPDKQTNYIQQEMSVTITLWHLPLIDLAVSALRRELFIRLVGIASYPNSTSRQPKKPGI
jgi:hypothetical protein